MNKKFYLGFALLIVCIIASAFTQSFEDMPYVHYDEPCMVLRVVDGDTVHIMYRGEDRTVRLVGVDTPETVHPTKPVEPYGPEASTFTKNLLRGETVWFIPDKEADQEDRYGRLLGHLYRCPDGLWVNLEIIRQGYGRAYTRYPFQHREEFVAWERTAKAAKKGLWVGVDE